MQGKFCSHSHQNRHIASFFQPGFTDGIVRHLEGYQLLGNEPVILVRRNPEPEKVKIEFVNISAFGRHAVFKSVRFQYVVILLNPFPPFFRQRDEVLQSIIGSPMKLGQAP